MEGNSIQHALECLITDVDGVCAGAPLSILTLGFFSGATKHSAYKLVKKFIDPINPKKMQLPLGSYRAFQRAQMKHETVTRAASIAPRTFLVSMVSQFDVFLSRLLKSLIQIRPEIVSSSERKLSFSEIADFDSIESVREHIVETEIDAFLRKSLSEQFSWLENKFDVQLRAGLDSWPELVELMQRRNLFVHADGVVNKQYRSVCMANKADIRNASLGKELLVTPDYLKHSRDVLIEVGTKLAHVLWRKTDKTAGEEADKQLGELTYLFLQNGRLALATSILDFAFLKPMKHEKKEQELMLRVNRANAYLLQGNKEKCAEILGSEDWSAYDRKFRLAKAVLSGKYQEMTTLMKAIGNGSIPAEHDYRDWPLFFSVSEREDFRETFKSTFSTDFIKSDNSKLQPSTEKATDSESLGKMLLSSVQSEEMKPWMNEVILALKPG